VPRLQFSFLILTASIASHANGLIVLGWHFLRLGHCRWPCDLIRDWVGLCLQSLGSGALAAGSGIVQGAGGAVGTIAPWTSHLADFGGKYAGMALTATSGFVDHALDAVGAGVQVGLDVGEGLVHAGSEAVHAVGDVLHEVEGRVETVTDGVMESKVGKTLELREKRDAVVGLTAFATLSLSNTVKAETAQERRERQVKVALARLACPVLVLVWRHAIDVAARQAYFAAVRMTVVSQWLHWNGLEVYAPRFHSEGYDDIEALKVSAQS
jgi:hypothetical protein